MFGSSHMNQNNNNNNNNHNNNNNNNNKTIVIIVKTSFQRGNLFGNCQSAINTSDNHNYKSNKTLQS